MEDIGYLFSKLSKEKLKISITNHADNISSTKNFKKWKLSSDRSLMLAYITKKLPQSKNHNFNVYSNPAKIDSSFEDIEFNIKFKPEFLDE